VLVTILSQVKETKPSLLALIWAIPNHRVSSVGEHLATVSPRGFTVFNGCSRLSQKP